ncbi:MAG: flavin oxidoreductase [Cytophagales bacterium]|nr:MAG: flavin oxidoreductase [Cytophagales bacterium]
MEKHLIAEDITQMQDRYRRNFVNALTGFKSLNLVGTIHTTTHQTNLAVFSQVFHIGANPALIGILFRPDSVPRHTLENYENTGYCTLNHVQASFYKQAHQTSARYDYSEFEAVGLTPFFSEHCKAPYVAESSLKIGLQWQERLDIRLNGTVLVIGSVVEVFLPENCLLEDGFIDIEKAGSITCSGLDSYHNTQIIGRLPYAKP